MDRCKTCSKPIMKPEDRCACNPANCFHCCTCGADCSCNCSKKGGAEKSKSGCGSCKGCKPCK